MRGGKTRSWWRKRGEGKRKRGDFYSLGNEGVPAPGTRKNERAFDDREGGEENCPSPSSEKKGMEQARRTGSASPAEQGEKKKRSTRYSSENHQPRSLEPLPAGRKRTVTAGGGPFGVAGGVRRTEKSRTR